VLSEPVVLIVEDQAPVAHALEVSLELQGVASITASSPSEALALLERTPDIRLVIQDMNFSPGATSGAEGVALFRTIRSEHPHVPIVLITAWGSLEVAVRLMKEGAADYLEKPWDEDRLAGTVRSLLTSGPNDGGPRESDLLQSADLCGIRWASSAMQDVISLAVKVARSDVPVLITGANGTGKERIADILQANSARRSRPWVKVNVAALPADLIEAELFGAEAGAYTGANRARQGRFEAADGGTLLLDEIGELPPSGQVTLLRVLQSGELQRLGSSETRSIDVRVIAATNADLGQAIADGRFREDLYFRLNVIEIDVPPLADRPEDILPLADLFLARYRLEQDRPELEIPTAVQTTLVNHTWPGNVRELENRIRRASLVAASAGITAQDLGLEAAGHSPPGSSSPLHPTDSEERRRIEAVLRQHDGVVSRAAENLGLSRQALYRRMARLGIVLERLPRSGNGS
jgi:DNA-binding NtrC family response regulator